MHSPNDPPFWSQQWRVFIGSGDIRLDESRRSVGTVVDVSLGPGGNRLCSFRRTGTRKHDTAIGYHDCTGNIRELDIIQYNWPRKDAIGRFRSSNKSWRIGDLCIDNGLRTRSLQMLLSYNRSKCRITWVSAVRPPVAISNPTWTWHRLMQRNVPEKGIYLAVVDSDTLICEA